MTDFVVYTSHSGELKLKIICSLSTAGRAKERVVSFTEAYPEQSTRFDCRNQCIGGQNGTAAGQAYEWSLGSVQEATAVVLSNTGARVCFK